MLNIGLNFATCEQTDILLVDFFTLSISSTSEITKDKDIPISSVRIPYSIHLSNIKVILFCFDRFLKSS